MRRLIIWSGTRQRVRSYEIREPIEVRVLPDSITVVSYPGPDRSIRLEDLETGRFVARRYRNRRIGEFLKELKLTEGRGTGIPKILKAMKANGSPKPQFETDDDRTCFIATFPVHSTSTKSSIWRNGNPGRKGFRFWSKPSNQIYQIQRGI